MSTIEICGNCNAPLASADARFCSNCGVKLLMESETYAPQQVVCKKQEPCTQQSECHQKVENREVTIPEANNTNTAPQKYQIEDLHSFALRLRERIIRMSGNARRGFRNVTDGMDSGSVSHARFVDSVRSTWGFASFDRDFVEATVDKYLAGSNGAVNYEQFSEFITNGPEPLDLCCDEQTALSAILLPMQDAFLRKHYTPHAAFLGIHAHEQGVVTINEIRNHVERYLRVASLGSISDETFKDVIQKAANIEDETLTYHDFARMLAYPYVNQQQWRRPSSSPQREETDNHPYRRYY